MRKWFTMCMTLLILSSLLAACGGNSSGTKTNDPAKPADNGTKTTDTKDVEIVFQSWITPNLTVAYYDSLINRFESENPGIKVKRIQPPANEGNPDSYLKSLLASGDFPDVVQNATIQMFVDADALLEIPIDDDIKKINNYEAEMINGKLYNISAIRQPQSLIFYNKKLFAEAGIESTPKTWAELEAAAEKLKAKGITPLLTAGDWTAGFTFSVMTSPDIYKDNKNWYADRFDNKVKFTDPNWIESATYYTNLVKNGYFNKGVLSIDYTAVEQEFLKGNGAMYPMGSWFSAAEANSKKDFEVGVFATPTKDGTQYLLGGENSGGYAVAKMSNHPEAALKFAKFMMLDPEAHKGILQADALFSNLKEPLKWDMSPLQTEIYELLLKNPPMVGHMNNKVGRVPVSGIQDQYNKVAQNILLGDTDVAKNMQSLDEYWDKNNK
ncbi:extracellular solute-binding protein [Paenibacillus sp. GCM10012307]|uniref:Maltodextrin-binding protein n=1 Tax=Paenibacillus roseus TaxID=2798579 RepID=A0A934MJP3_9BACL|nr:extracellular solute-binding protein [Paenibacillus roseus]MBJ6360130.1 extracellular solute-binding protein [Paenibacillus roseus]